MPFNQTADKNIMLCIKFVLEFTRLTLKVTILRENKYLIHTFWWKWS